MQTLMTPDRGQLLIGKNRNPFAVIFFSIITFGIYWLVWVYKVNNEVRKHEPVIRSSPGVSVIAQFVPIANIISDYNLATRIQRMEIADQSANQISPVVTIVLLFFFGIGYVFQIQSHLNAHWDGHRFAAQRLTQQLAAAQPQSLPMPSPQPQISVAMPPAAVPQQRLDGSLASLSSNEPLGGAPLPPPA
jgi:hypothetical protein